MHESARARIDSILQRALELEDDARRRFLDDACNRDEHLRAILERMVRDCADDEEPLLRPGAGASGPLWTELAREYSGYCAFEAGERLGAYEIVRMLGRGGSATVYLAQRADGQFAQSVALKVLDVARDFEQRQVRFAQERRILAALDHPNIARLIDGGATSSGQPYVVMEYVDGVPIDRHCDESKLTIEQRIALFQKVARAVQYAHGHLIVHRDIKPSNILATPNGEPKLLDFGIAKLLDPDSMDRAPLTQTALHPMTPEYASPEQVQGKPLTAASDVYQLGFLLYWLLTGRSPYPSNRGNVAEMVHAICSIEPLHASHAVAPRDAESGASTVDICAARSSTPERLRRRLAGDLDNILDCALQKDPRRRYPSALHLHDDLRRHLEGLPITARPPTIGYRSARFLRRHWVGTTAAAAVMLMLVVGSIALLIAYGQARRSAELALAAQSETAAINEFLRDILASPRPSVSGSKTLMTEVLDQAEARLPERFGDQPRLVSEIGVILAHSYESLARHEQAARLREVLLKERAAGWHAADGETLERAIELVGSYAELGRFEDAHTLLAEVRERIEVQPARKPLLTILADNAAGLLAYRGGDAVTAAQDFERAWLGAQQSLPADADAYRQIRSRRLTARLVMGKVTEAEPELRALLADNLERFGERHAETLQTRNLLLFALTELGQLDEAEQAARKNAEVAEAWLGEGDPYTITALNSLSSVLASRGSEEEASVVTARVLALARRVLGADHPNTLTILGNYAHRLENAGRFDEAEEVYRDLIELATRALGPEHRQTLLYRGNRAAYWRVRGRYAEAETELRAVVQAFERQSGAQSGDTLHFTGELGAVLRAFGRSVAAAQILAPALALANEAHGSSSPLTTRLAEELAAARSETESAAL